MNDEPKVSDILNILKNCKGYKGYKGGFFKMNYDAPLWDFVSLKRYSEFGKYSRQYVSGIEIKTDHVILKISGYMNEKHDKYDDYDPIYQQNHD